MRAKIICFVAMFLVALPLLADDRRIVEELKPQEVEQVLKELGFIGTEIDEDGDLIVTMQGYRMYLFCGSGDGKYLQFKFSISGANANMRTMNDWNAAKRFSRAYIDGDGDPVLEADLDLEGGVTMGRVRNFIQTFNASLGMFLREIS